MKPSAKYASLHQPGAWEYKPVQDFVYSCEYYTKPALAQHSPLSQLSACDHILDVKSDCGPSITEWSKEGQS